MPSDVSNLLATTITIAVQATEVAEPVYFTQDNGSFPASKDKQLVDNNTMSGSIDKTLGPRPLDGSQVYHFYLPIACGIIAIIYMLVWMWSYHRSWWSERRDIRSRLEHWRNHVHLGHSSKHISRRLHQWPRQVMDASRRKEKSNSLYTVQDNFLEKDGKADYSVYAGDIIYVEQQAGFSLNPPLHTIKHHRSLHDKHGWRRHKNREKPWVSYDLRHTYPATLTATAADHKKLQPDIAEVDTRSPKPLFEPACKSMSGCSSSSTVCELNMENL
ncbi:hypothetical protein INT43_005742 [Umbelopsis isabellina]|uniref:Uncharacterized protein n=1 Tax=Mortierella isabellina TaxID=91625 RepID=A0A8H7PLZ6_MORIS|nr:hypothetical protein INT43_005742 [Umbelopsis isabellina]